MFEKESRLWATKELGNGYVDDIDNHSKTFQKGAVFGYKLAHEEMDYLNKHWRSVEKKSNEWHDLRKDPNDLPKENMKQVMVITNYNECLMGWYSYSRNAWWSSDCPDVDDRIEIDNVKVIKWEEIILPKESE